MITAELGFDQKRLPSRAVQAVISQAKSELVDFETFREDARSGPDPFRKRIADIYAQYQQRLLAANALDFDDLLMVTANLLQAYDDVRASYQERFRHILVDEFQDTNHAQNEIVKLLGEAHGNVCVVGDSDQSVYRWRGADIRNILEFERAFPNVTTIMLEQNFRSTQTILDAANAVIANNVGRQPKELFTVGDTGGPVTRYRAEDERDEAQLGRRARSCACTRRTSLTWGDFAVFYRTNAQSLPLETSMKFSGIPYKVVGGAKFYDRREIKDILAFIRVLANPDDEVSARRIVNVPKRGIGDTSVARLAAWAQVEHVPFSEAIDRAEEAGLTGQGAARAPSSCPRRWPSCARWCRRSTRPTSCSWWPTAPATWPSWWPSTPTRRTAGLRTWPSWPPRPGDFDDVHGLLGDGGAGGGLRRARQRRHPGLADDAAHGQGPRVPGRLRGGTGGGDLPALPLPVRAERARGGAPALLCRDHPGPPASGHFACLVAHDLGPHPAGHAQPFRHRGAGAPGRGRRPRLDPRRGTGYDAGPWRVLSGEEHLPGATFSPAVPLAAASGARRAGSRGSTGAEDLGLAPATRWCTSTGALAWCFRPRARVPGPRPRSTSTRWARRTCCSRPRRCGGPEASASARSRTQPTNEFGELGRSSELRVAGDQRRAECACQFDIEGHGQWEMVSSSPGTGHRARRRGGARSEPPPWFRRNGTRRRRRVSLCARAARDWQALLRRRGRERGGSIRLYERSTQDRPEH